MNSINIAIIDDEKEILDMLESFFRRKAVYQVTTYQNPLHALEHINPATHIVLLDIMMPQINGLELLPRLQQKFPQLKVVMMTAYSTLDKVLDAHRIGANHYIMKPFESLGELEGKIAEIVNAG
jgi:DNA-binding NtrC family response regulator